VDKKSYLSEIMKTKKPLGDKSLVHFMSKEQDIHEAPIMRTGNFLKDMSRALYANYKDMATSYANDFGDSNFQFINWAKKLQFKLKIRDPKDEKDYVRLYDVVKDW